MHFADRSFLNSKGTRQFDPSKTAADDATNIIAEHATVAEQTTVTEKTIVMEHISEPDISLHCDKSYKIHTEDSSYYNDLTVIV